MKQQRRNHKVDQRAAESPGQKEEEDEEEEEDVCTALSARRSVLSPRVEQKRVTDMRDGAFSVMD